MSSPPFTPGSLASAVSALRTRALGLTHVALLICVRHPWACSVIKSFPYRTMKALVLRGVDLEAPRGVEQLRDRCRKGQSTVYQVLPGAVI